MFNLGKLQTPSQWLIINGINLLFPNFQKVFRTLERLVKTKLAEVRRHTKRRTDDCRTKLVIKLKITAVSSLISC